MKKILYITLLHFFLFFNISLSAQNIRFSFDITSLSSTVSEVSIYAQTTGGTENLTGYTTYFYYNSNETTLTTMDSSPTTGAAGLNWGTANQTNIMHQSENNANVTNTHTGYFFYQNFDNAFAGTDMTTSPTLLLILTFDHSIGMMESGSGWLAETDEVPPLQYVNNLFESYDVITMGNQSQILPVELTHFEVKAVGDDALLEWITVSEINASHFEIERSSDGRNWSRIGNQDANGTNNETNYYNFYDENPKNGINYYRLKQMDFDGEYEYSTIKNVLFNNELVEYSIFPNPTKATSININIPNGIATVSLYCGNGMLHYEKELGEGNRTFSLPDLVQGIYFVKFSQEGKTQIKRLIIIE